MAETQPAAIFKVLPMSQPVSPYQPGPSAPPPHPQSTYGQQPTYAPPPSYGQPVYGQAPQPGQRQPQPGYPPQHYPQPQPGYPPQHYPQAQPGYPPQQQTAMAQPTQAAPAGYPAAQASPELECRLCRSVPAARAKFRGHQGMLIIMRFLSLDGPFCRDCGLATYRNMTSRTLVQGWWGYVSFIITPLTVLWNLIPRQKVASLPPPRPAAHGQSHRPLDPGAPLLMRPMSIIGLAIPPALIMLFIFLIVLRSA
jgi:hypothetical protein